MLSAALRLGRPISRLLVSPHRIAVLRSLSFAILPLSKVRRAPLHVGAPACAIDVEPRVIFEPTERLPSPAETQEQEQPSRVQCKALTTNGDKCKNMADPNHGYCHFHGGPLLGKKESSGKQKKQCVFMKADGTQCKIMHSDESSVFCHHHRPGQTTSDKVRCIANKADGSQCKRLVTHESGLCHTHRGDRSPKGSQCLGFKQDGSACSIYHTDESGYCHHHRDQAAP
jgi:hypothetical protein